MPKAKYILPILVFSQFCCTSIWFAGNGVMADLLLTFNLKAEALGYLTSAVQLGFIAGTLVFAFLGIADRFSPSRVFFVCALAGALFNLGMIAEANNFGSLLLLRFFIGVSLAGIYPVGMKIAADYYRDGLGTSLGYLVGALVLGTAFPHLVRSFAGTDVLPWMTVIFTTSGLAILGGLFLLLLVPDGPYRKPLLKMEFSSFIKVFKDRDFRGAAFGYFGHMWELYAFWAFVPVILSGYRLLHPVSDFNVPLFSFVIIAAGSLGCIAGGYLSRLFGHRKTAASALFLSGCCCLLSPLFFLQGSEVLLFIFLVFWGIMVVADSPLFSTLVAKNAPAAYKGTALTAVNCIGFAVTVFSIQLLDFLLRGLSPVYVLTILAIGPVFGLWALFGRRAKPMIS